MNSEAYQSYKRIKEQYRARQPQIERRRERKREKRLGYGNLENRWEIRERERERKRIGDKRINRDVERERERLFILEREAYKYGFAGVIGRGYALTWQQRERERVCACVFWCWCRCCCCCCKLLKPKALHHLELATWRNETLFLSLSPSSKIFPFLFFFLILCFSLFPPSLPYSLITHRQRDRIVFHPPSLSFSFSFFSHNSRHQLLCWWYFGC